MSNILIRRWHAYIGLFIAPSVLFFAITGMVQIYSLHESHDDYVPPAIVEKLSSIHKDQVFAPSHHHEAAPEDGKANDDDDKPALPTLLLKGFFFFVALSLSCSTAFGLWMGLTQTRQKRLSWTLVIAGALLPVGLLIL